MEKIDLVKLIPHKCLAVRIERRSKKFSCYASSLIGIYRDYRYSTEGKVFVLPLNGEGDDDPFDIDPGMYEVRYFTAIDSADYVTLCEDCGFGHTEEDRNHLNLMIWKSGVNLSPSMRHELECFMLNR